MSSSLITSSTKIKVSSTLDKSLGKKFLTDGSPETCWTSAQGIPQYIQLGFESPVQPSKIFLTFQGGFVGTRCAVHVQPPAGNWFLLTNIFPEDVNRRQTFDLPAAVSEGVENMKLIFEESSDFFGRITVYDLVIEGETFGR